MLTPFVPLLFQPLALESLLFDVTPLEPLPLKLMPLEPLPVDLRSHHLQCAAAILDRGNEWWPRLGSVATGI